MNREKMQIVLDALRHMRDHAVPAPDPRVEHVAGGGFDLTKQEKCARIQSWL